MMYIRVHLSASISLYLTVGCNVFLKATAVGHKIKNENSGNYEMDYTC